MSKRRFISAMAMILIAVALLAGFLAKADDVDEPAGVVNLGDR